MYKRNEELDAISWKCQQLGISYGKLMQKCTQQDIRQICREYEEARRIKKDRGSYPRENQSGPRQHPAR